MKLFDPESGFVLQWNRVFLLRSLLALSLDPLFLYIPIVNVTQTCLDMDRNLAIVVCVLRSFTDILYVLHIIIQFQTAYVPNHHVHGMRMTGRPSYYVAKRYLTSYFIIDVFAALPLPQLAVLIIIPNLDMPTSFSTENFLKLIIFTQYIPRAIRTWLFYQKVTKISGFLLENAWAGAAFNFFLYVLASYVVGALWYLYAIESAVRCWHTACQRHNCHSKYLYCGNGRVGDYGFLNASCSLLGQNEIKNSSDFDFGIFLDALQKGVLEKRNFPHKILICSWWGLQNLSSIGQGLKSSTFSGEILFASFITTVGLILYGLLLGNMQKYMQFFSSLTNRMEEMRENKRETEDFMSHLTLPEVLRQRVRRYQQFKRNVTHGVDLDSFVRDLPRDLGRDIKRHLCLSSLMKVPIFKEMDERLLDHVCDRLKLVLYPQNSYIVREGDPAREMLFITSGEIQSTTTVVGSTSCSNPSNLKAGDCCGEELLSWASKEKRIQLPFSTTTLEALTDVQAYALVADELAFVVSQFRMLHYTHILHTSRNCAQNNSSRRGAAQRDASPDSLLSRGPRFYSQQSEKVLEPAIKRRHNVLATGRETSTNLKGRRGAVKRDPSPDSPLCRGPRFYSQQSAWRKHYEKKREKLLEATNKRRQDVFTTDCETSSNISFGASIYVCRFSSLLRILWRRRRSEMCKAQVSTQCGCVARRLQ